MIFIFLFLIIHYKEKFYNSVTKVLGLFSFRMANKSVHVFEMLVQGFSSLKGTKNYLYTIALSLMIMLNYALNSYLGFYTLGMQNNVTFGMAWVLMSIGSIGVIIPTPGGLGSYHALATAVLTLLFHFPQSESLAYGYYTFYFLLFIYFYCIIILLFIK